MRTLTRILLSAGGAGLVGLAPAIALAQNDVTPHLPNVLLLLDTSGSMDFLVAPDPADGVTPLTPESPHAPAGAACTLNGNTTVMTRWASLVSVLTGSFQPGAFGCETLYRNESKFVSEFALPGTSTPYDYNYYIPWHRIYSNSCTLGASQMSSPQDWTAWGNNPYDLHNNLGTCAKGANPQNCCSAWTGQNNDGLLDAFAGFVRFGMMTFDNFPSPATGATPGTPSYVDGSGAVAGMWSYFHNWQTASPPAVPTLVGKNNKPAAGNPDGCATASYMEVGARNPAAPPWEGPLTGFGDPLSDSGIAQINAAIQQQILSMRPYGATPIAGMLDDASEFLFKDTSAAPGVTPSRDFGPYNDPYWKGGCRKTYAILLTDGSPNLDLRGPTGQCDSTQGPNNGNCPYDTPENILTAMRLTPATGNMNQSVTTFVVGFAMSSPAALPAGKTSCSQLDPIADCSPPAVVPAALQQCCELQKLAAAGGGTGAVAYFADNAGQLKQVLATILSQIIGSTTARTVPMYAAAGPANAQGTQFASTPAQTYQFAASFNVTSSPTVTAASTSSSNTPNNVTTGLWSGNLVRERYVCQNGTPTPQPINPAVGDNYASNLDTPDGSHPRQFFTVIGNTVNSNGQSLIHSDWTIRPNLTTDDGFGVYQALTPTSPVLTPATTFPTLMSSYPPAFGVLPTTDPNCNNAFGVASSPNTCVQDLVNWEIGGTNTLSTAFMPAVSRNPSSPYCTENPARKCSSLGAIYHSTPVIIGPPREFLRDDTYTAYANDPNVANKPIMLYTATTDGQLHGFKVAASVNTDTFTTDTLANNELWSFLPPAVLQHLLPNFNSGGSNLLDGAPVVADIPAASAVGIVPPVFERTPSSAPKWHRVLVASGGQAGGFYYALDVTDPTNPSFLWQISTDSAGNRLFGATTPTPAIAIVAIVENGTRTQVPVAILAGGSGTLLGSCPTPPAFPARPSVTLNDPFNPSNPNGSVFHINGFNAPPLRCWQSYSATNNNTNNFNPGSAATGNSITIVRLDTGAVLAHITGTGYYGAVGGGVVGDPGSSLNGSTTGNIFTTRPFTAPITGVPVVYPADTGQVADRVYVGDADGQLWRIDLTSTDPHQWAATSTTSTAPPGLTLAWDAYLDLNTSARESIQIAPVLSRDPVGNTTILFATGDQNLLTSVSTDNRVWSLTETPLTFNTSQNWYLKFARGAQRVTGPMALFNDVLYFSTYTPVAPNGAVCADGYPSLWAVDYRRPNPALQPYIGAPLPMFGTPPTLSQDGANGSVIFGVSVTETPSCGSTQSVTDPYFGPHTQVSGVAPSEYRVMWQTGSGSGLNTSSNVRNESSVQGMQNMTIPAPGQSTRIDSWAAIVE